MMIAIELTERQAEYTVKALKECIEQDEEYLGYLYEDGAQDERVQAIRLDLEAGREAFRTIRGAADG